MVRLVIVTTLAILSGCAYTSNPALDMRLRSCKVSQFANISGYPELAGKLKAEVTRKFLLDGTLRPVASGEDTKLTGRVIKVVRRSLQEDAYDDTLTGSVELIVAITLLGPTGEPLLKEERVSSRDTFRATGTYRRDLGATETSAMDSALDALARNIVRRCVEVW